MKQDIVSILKGEPPKVILLTGDDTIGRERAKEKITEKIYTQFDDVTDERFDSLVEPFELFIERTITPSLFQTIRIFHIRHAQDLSDDKLQKLRFILSADLPDVYIFIEFEERNRKKSKMEGVPEKLDIKAKIRDNPVKYAYLRFEKPPDYKMAQWLMNQVPLFFQREISKAGAECLLDLAGFEIDKLYSELHKIDIHLPDRAPIDKAAIESITGASRSVKPFELAEALGRKDLPRVLEIIESLYNANFYAPSSVAAIFKHFWKILKIYAFANENKDIVNAYFRTKYREQTKIAHEIGAATGLLRQSDPESRAYPVMILSGIIDQAVKYKIEHLKQIFTWLREFDVGVKKGLVKPTKQAFQLLCYRIVRVAQLKEKDTLL